MTTGDCDCGFSGVNCTHENVIKTYNVVGGFILQALLLLLCIFILHRSNEKKNFHDIKDEDFVTSRYNFIATSLFFAYRICVSVFAVISWIFLFTDSGSLLFFTDWNFLLFSLLFFLITALSFENVMEWKLNVYVRGSVYILMQALVPSVVALTIVTWAILFPQSKSAGHPHEFLSFSGIAPHGINVLLLLIDFWVNKLYFTKAGSAYLIILIVAYSFFHQVLMLIRKAEGQPHCPIYSFLDMSVSVYIPFLFGLFFLFMVSFVVFYKVSELKKGPVSSPNDSAATTEIEMATKDTERN